MQILTVLFSTSVILHNLNYKHPTLHQHHHILPDNSSNAIFSSNSWDLQSKHSIIFHCPTFLYFSSPSLPSLQFMILQHHICIHSQLHSFTLGRQDSNCSQNPTLHLLQTPPEHLTLSRGKMLSTLTDHSSTHAYPTAPQILLDFSTSFTPQSHL